MTGINGCKTSLVFTFYGIIMKKLTDFFPCNSIAILFFFLPNSFYAQQFALKAAVVRINITPSSPKYLLGYGKRISTGIHDSLYNRILLMDDGKTEFVIATTEVCELSPSEYDIMAAMVKQKTGIDPLHFWWSVTHTHSAPETGMPGVASIFAMGDRYNGHPVDTAYTNLVENAIINGIIEARKNLEPVQFGIGWGFSQANINRRAVDADGSASIGLNPDGAVDRRIGLIRLEKRDGKALALIANYPIHGTVLGEENLKISGDAPGVVEEYVEQKTGATLLFINGAAGNLAPIYSVYPNPEDGHLSQFKVLLGDKIMEANNRIKCSSSPVKFFASSVMIESPRKHGLQWPDYLNNYSSKKNGVNMIKIPVRFLRINDDIAIWAAPVELFCEIANKIRDLSPFAYTFYYGYTNGWLGYLPDEKSWQQGGYEIDEACAFTPEVTPAFTDAVIGYLQGELRSGSTNPPVIKKKN